MRNVLGCAPTISRFYNLRIPTFFTPNGDGINDFFTIPDLEFFSNSQLEIFDRFGKLLHQDASPFIRWDGTYNGIRLPVTDYWYSLKLNNETIIGHVSLLVLQ